MTDAQRTAINTPTDVLVTALRAVLDTLSPLATNVQTAIAPTRPEEFPLTGAMTTVADATFYTAAARYALQLRAAGISAPVLPL